jgi:hypothetical protein
VDRLGRAVEGAQPVRHVRGGHPALGLRRGGQLVGRVGRHDRGSERPKLDQLLRDPSGLEPGDPHQIHVDAIAANALFKHHVVAPVRLLAPAFGVVLVDASDGLVGEAQSQLLDDEAEVAD